MNKIKSYIPPAPSIKATFYKDHGGFKAGKMHPMTIGSQTILWRSNEVLDNITLAIETGRIDRDRFVQQCFSEIWMFAGFAEALLAPPSFRLPDRVWFAFAKLVEYDGSFSMATTSELAAALITYASKTEQISESRLRATVL